MCLKCPYFEKKTFVCRPKNPPVSKIACHAMDGSPARPRDLNSDFQKHPYAKSFTVSDPESLKASIIHIIFVSQGFLILDSGEQSALKSLASKDGYISMS